jgi:hypothetical protein
VLDHAMQTTRGIFVKIPQVTDDEAAKKIYETLRTLYAFSTQLPEELNVVRPLDYMPEISAVLTERVDGEELYALLRRSRGAVELANILRDCGRFLRAYHKGLGQLTWSTDLAQTFINRCQVYLTQLQDYDIGKAKAHHILTEFERGAEQLNRGVEVCLTSDDFSVRNIIVQGKRLFLIEATQPRRKAIYDDLATFLNSLTMLFWDSPWFFVGRQSRAGLHDQFLSGYFTHHISREIIALYCAKSLCFRWVRALNSLALKQRDLTRLFPGFALKHAINRFFYRHIMEQLTRARGL